MAFVDLETEKIYGTKEGSYTWYHEKGHIEFHKLESGNQLQFWKDQIFVWIVLSTAIGLFLKHPFFEFLPFPLALMFILIYFYEEAWCWGYALKEKRRLKNGA